jgi:hypothetical protein
MVEDEDYDALSLEVERLRALVSTLEDQVHILRVKLRQSEDDLASFLRYGSDFHY